MGAFKDLTGQQFGELTVVSCTNTKNPQGNYLWKCKCSCGNFYIVAGGKLQSGHVKSCGHLREITYDCRHNRLYRIYYGMKSRCYNTKCKDYSNWGGRGIQMCEEWRNSFEVFQEWATKHGYSPDLTIDRINNDGDYEPSNCRWATLTQQANNRRLPNSKRVIFITYNNETHRIKEWAQIFGVNPIMIYKRYRTVLKNNESIDRVFRNLTPTKKENK